MNRLAGWNCLGTLRARRTRAGLSAIELIGCFLAIGVGVWAGATYMGIDLRAAWQLGMEKAGVVEPGQDATFGVLGEPEGTKNTDENGELTGDESSSGGAANEAGDDADIVGQRTLEYWNQLNAIMLKEEQIRQVPLTGLTSSNAGAFVESRGKASQFAVDSIEKLDTDNVDPEVLKLGQSILEWYKQGVRLSDQATSLLDATDLATRKGPLGKKWAGQEQQHLQEVELINRKGDALRARMSNKYGVVFPDLR